MGAGRGVFELIWAVWIDQEPDAIAQGDGLREVLVSSVYPMTILLLKTLSPALPF